MLKSRLLLNQFLYSAQPDYGYNLIIIDPPWENGSVYQKAVYVCWSLSLWPGTLLICHHLLPFVYVEPWAVKQESIVCWVDDFEVGWASSCLNCWYNDWLMTGNFSFLTCHEWSQRMIIWEDKLLFTLEKRNADNLEFPLQYCWIFIEYQKCIYVFYLKFVDEIRNLMINKVVEVCWIVWMLAHGSVVSLQRIGKSELIWFLFIMHLVLSMSYMIVDS